MEHGRNKYLFDYEALWDESNLSWSLALDLPVIGQELIRFKINDKNQRVKVTGTFANRLQQELSQHSQRRLLSVFYRKVGELLSITKGVHKMTSLKGWTEEVKDGGLLLTAKGSKGSLFQLNGFNESGYFKRITLSYVGKSSNISQKIIKLQLFVRGCEL